LIHESVRPILAPMCRAAAVLLLALAACASGAPPRPSPSAVAVQPGAWTMMRFLGGPPADGQITDTTTVDPARDHRVRVARNRAGAPADTACGADAPDDGAWRDLLAAMADPDLAAGLAHPDHVPPLLIDVGYFACAHGGVRIAVSDLGVNDARAPREATALRRLSSAYQRVHDEVVALPACTGL
jgi:hypothetical protein